MLPKKLKFVVHILIILLLLVSFAIMGVYVGYNYVITQEERFTALEASIEDGSFKVDMNTEGAIPFVIRTGDMTSDIADQLFELGLIDNTFMFSLLSKVNGFDGAYQAGTHYLLQGLDYDEIMFLLTQRSVSVTVTFPEGITYEEMKVKLHEAGLTFSDEEMDECMDSPNLFTDYRFVSQIELVEGRDHVLSGYLFPDTYEFDVNASAETIISTMLNNTENKLYDEYYERAESLGMSMDQIMTLASIIQAESSNMTDMMYISSVFRNRMNSSDESMHYLGSDATVNFIRRMNGLDPDLFLTADDISLDSPYNTYMYQGLPPGPICMPGQDAIQAALYPEPNSNYMYFCADGYGGTLFAVTLAEHENNVATFQANWEARQAEEAAQAAAEAAGVDTSETYQEAG
ncbi:MAG: endolytic transglycosylase MltG [Clostridiales bacterium]|nr:endolytic transglycosylase MltG [Clostridiales bacterium]MBP3809838.1 endolytic transglycosylase MltG [Clostridiales bacterium]